jgi:hypothetical protein
MSGFVVGLSSLSLAPVAFDMLSMGAGLYFKLCDVEKTRNHLHIDKQRPRLLILTIE